MQRITALSQSAIRLLQARIAALGYTPILHFELEGTYTPPATHSNRFSHALDFPTATSALRSLGLQGELKPEYWPCQWEWASDFAQQTPLESATQLSAAMQHIPAVLRQQHMQAHIHPVTWNALSGRLAEGSKTLFDASTTPVHIPNAIQVNLSARDASGHNAIPTTGLGERLQQYLLHTSHDYCLLFTPEPQAFERLLLKRKYGLSRELSSPQDISGGHQGSIALYKELGKHNQKMGETPILYDAQHNVIATKQDWQHLSRIEHRLGSSSLHYNPFANTAFMLTNLYHALLLQQGQSPPVSLTTTQHSELPPDWPTSLAAFSSSSWLESSLNHLEPHLGSNFKAAILDHYRKLTT